MVGKTLDQELGDFKHRKESNDMARDIAEQSEAVQHELARRTANYPKERDVANQLHGRAVLLGGLKRFFTAAEIKTVKEIKEGKLFKHILITDAAGEFRPCGDFSEYCKFGLGVSHSSMYEHIQNYDVFGEALDGIRTIGIERNQLRLLRKAPDQIIEEVKNAAEKNDKEALLDLIDEQAIRHDKEKEAMAQEKQELKDQLKRAQSEQEASQRLLADKDQKINELDRELRRDFSPDEEKQRRMDLDSEQQSKLKDKEFSCIAALNELSQVVDEVLGREDRTEYLDETLYGSLRGVLRHALSVARDHQIDPVHVLDLQLDVEKLDVMLDQGC
jgi:hypothetical protein